MVEKLEYGRSAELRGRTPVGFCVRRSLVMERSFLTIYGEVVSYNIWSNLRMSDYDSALNIGQQSDNKMLEGDIIV